MSFLDQFRLEGGRALVTGASRGIGKAVAEALAEAGCDVAVAARTLHALRPTVAAVEERGRKALALEGDLALREVATGLVERAAAGLGGLDVVVLNAGVLPHGDDGAVLLEPLHRADPEDWNTVIAVNLSATATLAGAAHDHLVASGRGSLILMSSIAGVASLPGLEAYGAAKAAQLSLVRSLAVGWARQGVRVNALCPGWTRTDMTAFATGSEALSDWLTSHVPLGRWATTDEIAAATIFLASPAASYVSGHALFVDGGITVPEIGLGGFPKPPSPLAGD
ncbi:SDR family NAD(P)-dependent oxidoreductase [Streptomyces griseus]|uniref:SDR family NAD(P)-dependent oxidoreductase n=1 Tax=Streptomyces griseus TaxID=1911 RepID=UPI0004C6E897|nr:SDR family NAD(P)-dependent oxidoreductase [Streptomyces griseus]